MIPTFLPLIVGAILFGGWVERSATKRGVANATFLNSRAILVLGFLLAALILGAVGIPTSLAGLIALAIGALTVDYVCMVVVGKLWWRIDWWLSARIFLGWYIGWLVLSVIGAVILVRASAVLGIRLH